MEDLELVWQERDLIKKQLVQMYEHEAELQGTDSNSKEIKELRQNILMGERALGELDASLQELSIRKDNPDDD